MVQEEYSNRHVLRVSICCAVIGTGLRIMVRRGCNFLSLRCCA